MSNLLEMFNIVPDAIKVAWVLWIGWGIAQVGWYRRTRQPSAELARANATHATHAPQQRHHSSAVRRSTSRAPLPVSTMEKQPWEQNNS